MGCPCDLPSPHMSTFSFLFNNPSKLISTKKYERQSSLERSSATSCIIIQILHYRLPPCHTVLYLMVLTGLWGWNLIINDELWGTKLREEERVHERWSRSDVSDPYKTSATSWKTCDERVIASQVRLPGPLGETCPLFYSVQQLKHSRLESIIFLVMSNFLKRQRRY